MLLRLILLLLILAAPAMGAVSERTFTAHDPGTSGDGNGFELNPMNAAQLIEDADESAAFDNASGTACGGPTSPACGCDSAVRDSHRFYGWGHAANVPTDAYIQGLGVRLRAKSNSNVSNPALYVRLSINGGSSWSPCRGPIALTEEYQTFPTNPSVNGTLGGPTDLWGLTLDADDVRSNVLFVVETWTAAGSGARDFSLDALTSLVHFIVDTPTPTVTPTGPTQTPVNTPTRTPTSTPTPLGNVLTVNSHLDCNDIDPGDGFCSSEEGNPCGQCCIAAAIQESNAAAGVQRIVIPEGDYELDRDDEELAEITAPVIIEGQGATATGVRIHLSNQMVRFVSQAAVDVSARRLSIWSGTQRRGSAGQLGGCWAVPNGGELSLTDVLFDRCDNQVGDSAVDAGNGSMGGSIFLGGGAILRFDGLRIEQGGATWGGQIAAIGDSKIYGTRGIFHGGVARGTGVIPLPDVECGDTVGGGGCIFVAGTGASEVIIENSTFESCWAYKGLGGGAFLNGDNGGQDLSIVGGGPDRGVADVGTGGLIRLTNTTINLSRARATRGSAGMSFGGDVEFYHVSSYGKQQARCDSSFELFAGVHFKARNSLLGGFNLSIPATGYRMCGGDGTATFDLVNTYDDSNPTGTSYNGELPTPCPSAIPVGDVCLSSTVGQYGGPTETLKPLKAGCVSTKVGNVLGLTSGASPVIDMAPCLPEVTTDQRGIARPQSFSESPSHTGGLCDLGAFEIQVGE